MHQNNIIWVTSINQKIYKQYAHEYLPTWKNLPGKKLCFLDEPIENFLSDFETHPTDVCLKNTKQPEKYFEVYGTKRKPIKWYLKSRVTSYMLENVTADYLIWLDADVEVLQPMDIEKFLPRTELLSTIYKPEGLDSGFVCFNTKHADYKQFVREYSDAWYNDMILESKHPGDAHILEILNKKYQYRNLFLGKVIKGKAHVDFYDTEVEPYLLHHVGVTKEKISV